MDLKALLRVFTVLVSTIFKLLWQIVQIIFYSLDSARIKGANIAAERKLNKEREQENALWEQHEAERRSRNTIYGPQ